MTERAEVNKQIELYQEKGDGWAYQIGERPPLKRSCFFGVEIDRKCQLQVSLQLFSLKQIC